MSVALVIQSTDLRAARDLALENVNDVVLVVGAGLKVTYVSPSVRKFGYQPDDLIGQPVHDFIHPEDAVRAAANFAAVERGETFPDFQGRQCRYRRADGAWIWMEGSPTLLRDADGAIVGMVNVLRDVTEHRQHQDLFESAFRHAAIGMALVDLDGRILRVNGAFCRMIGSDEAALLGTSYRDLRDPDDLGVDPAPIAKLFAGEIDSYTRKRRYLRADGGILEASLTVALVHGPDGAPTGYIGQVQDLTEQRAAEVSERQIRERYRLIAEHTSDIIILSDPDGVVQYVSQAIGATANSAAAVVGQNCADFIHPDDWPNVRKVFGRLLSGHTGERVRWRGRRGDGGPWMWVESGPTLLRHPETGEPTGFLDVVRDVSEQIAQEEALRAASIAAEAGAEAKAQFLANVSHEIRTPLTAILGFANLLRELPDLGAAASGYVQRIGSAGSALLAIVNDILDHSLLEAGKIEFRPRPADIAALARESLELFEAQADAKQLSLNLKLSPELPPVVLVDTDRLRQILINLVGNAVKFTSQGGVELSVEAAVGDTLRVTVKDTGPGLEVPQQERLFERFSQVDGSSTRQHGGTGLGLAICRGLVEAMGGEIGVESVPGEGATFWFTLRAPAARYSADTAANPGVVTLDDLRVLVVDDNASNRDLVFEVLTALGAEVTLAVDGQEAMALLAIAPMDIVLIDMHLPDTNGLSVLTHMRSAPGPNRDIPALAFTAVDAATTDLSDFDGVVSKPFDVSAIVTEITSAIAGPTPQNQDILNAGLG